MADRRHGRQISRRPRPWPSAAAVAPRTPWFGMMACGEIAPCNGLPAFHNYTYVLAALTET